MNLTDGQVQSAGPSDAADVLALLDRAVVDMVRTGSAGQWGTEPWSQQPRRVQTVTTMLTEPANRSWVVRISGMAVGVVVIGPRAPAYVPAADEPESYVHLLATDRSESARGWGRQLLTHVADAAPADGLTRQRVDCWAGADRFLVRFYESCGFTADSDFAVGDWPGTVLSKSLV